MLGLEFLSTHTLDVANDGIKCIKISCFGLTLTIPPASFASKRRVWGWKGGVSVWCPSAWTHGGIGCWWKAPQISRSRACCSRCCCSRTTVTGWSLVIARSWVSSPYLRRKLDDRGTWLVATREAMDTETCLLRSDKLEEFIQHDRRVSTSKERQTN